MSGPSFGKELPDQVDLLNQRVEAQLLLLQDIRELVTARVVLEKEYATKLQVIARKAAEKKNKHIASVVLGNDPSKPWGEDVIKKSTLDRAVSILFEAFESAATEHSHYADSLNLQVAESLKSLEKKKEESRKKEMTYFTKLVSDRDKVYADRTKTRQKYYDECIEIETYRQKQDKAHDDKHADRAAKQYEQQKIDVLNGKNTYIIATAIANKTKARFYEEDLPTLENQFQSLQTTIIHRIASVMTAMTSTTEAHVRNLIARLGAISSTISQIDSVKDNELFVEYNKRAFEVPNDWQFEVCESYYDTDDINTDAAPKVVLQNKLKRSKTKLAEIVPIAEAKARELSKYEGLVSAYEENPSLGDVDELYDNYFEAQNQYTQLSSLKTALETEVEVISEAIGGDEGAQNPHTFKSSSFSIPTPCAYCKNSIWGLSKQGKTCKQCGISVHAKCELKIPADCSSSSRKGHRTVSSVSSISCVTTKPGASHLEPPSTPSAVSSHPPSPRFDEEVITMNALAIFQFTASSPFELGVKEGQTVTLLEEDDGSGWVKVQDSAGSKGLVPASYIRLHSDEEESVVETVPSSTQGSGKFVKGVYDYEAQGPDELSVKVSTLIELTPDGENYGEGWWEGVDKEGRKGIFPNNYVALVS